MADAFDVVVAGAGVGGISAAVSAARLGARTLLIEQASAIGGTGVHSPVGLICTFFDRSLRVINAGVHREFFPHIYKMDRTQIMTYDERTLAANYRQVIDAEPLLTVRTATVVCETEVSPTVPRRLVAVRTEGGHNGWTRAHTFVDATADGNLAALAGAAYAKGRDADGRMQPATLTFKVSDIDFSKFACPLPRGTVTTWAEYYAVLEELNGVYQLARQAGRVNIPRDGVLALPYPGDTTSMLFNQTRILGVDPTEPASVQRGLAEGRRQVAQFMAVMREHPAFANARIAFISDKLGVREGRRILGDYVLTAEDCLGEARFDDMIVAAGYHIDIHNPHGAGTTMTPIPGSGYYHIPYRCLYSRDFANLLMGSRCISGTHEAHSSYRVMAPVSAIGQASGTAAALMTITDRSDVRDNDAAEIRYLLHAADQFVEGPLKPIAKVSDPIPVG
jgi:hypothetical protein